MLKEGMLLQERYEIISRIGSGGMADVYKAKDHKLNRFVAVKVLKKEFREDKAYISKFRVEAQSAAGLAHPNIVNVYDVGEEEGVFFIVMELVEGITLKDYIEKKGRLAVREATSIAIQVSMGLQAAHNNGIVHRDVKPQNIIISTDGKVKVTDFGIARAASSNTISSNAMGSVHYSSPEQARGGYSDYKSDIYSLGITMYEMLTGHVPFDGETTVAIALKHLQEEMQSPRKYVPDLPKSTVQIIYKCTQKSPDRRYQDMEELIRDLKESLVNPEGDFVQIAPVNTHAQTIVISKDEVNQINGTREVQPPDESYLNVNMTQPPVQPQPYYSYEDEDDEKPESGVSKGLERFMTIGSILIGLAILVIFLGLVGSAVGLYDLGEIFSGKKPETEAVTEAATEATESAEVQVPDLLGKTEAEAKTLLNDAGLGLNYAGEEPSADYAAGQIIAQKPLSGETAARNSTVSYTLSAGKNAMTMPNLAYMTYDDAKAKLESLGFSCEKESVYDGAVGEGLVSYTSPGNGNDVEAGAMVTVYISTGGSSSEDGTVTIPDMIGVDADAASSALENMGLTVETKTTEDTSYDNNAVVEQDIADGTTVDQGTTITLIVNTASKAAETSQETTSTAEGTTESAPQTIDASDAGTGKYSTNNVKLDAPSDYAGENVRIEIVQDGVTTVLVDGQPVEFPYKLNVKSDSQSSGTAYVYVLNDEGKEVKKVEYKGVPFK